jgi:hypothetical protein
VLEVAPTELRALGHLELAREVRRVSLLSDQLGYDINAPRVTGAPRLLEVKASTAPATNRSAVVHLTRNEADTGAALADWALVVCVVDDVEQRSGRIVGWCAGGVLVDLVPLDGTCSRWDHATVDVPVERLSPGLPSVVA